MAVVVSAASELGKALYGDYSPFLGRLSSMASMLGLPKAANNPMLPRTRSVGAMPIYVAEAESLSVRFDCDVETDCSGPSGLSGGDLSRPYRPSPPAAGYCCI